MWQTRKEGNALEQKVTSAELLFSNFIIEHNLPLPLRIMLETYFAACFLIRTLQKITNLQGPKQER